MNEEIKQAVREAIGDSIAKFYVGREQHYNDHQFIKELRDFFSNIRGTATRTLVGILITGVISLIVLGFIFWGKKHI